MLIEIKGTRGTLHYINPERVDAISIQDDGYAFIRAGGDSFQTEPEEAKKMLALINGAAASKAIPHDQAPTPAKDYTGTSLLAMTRDVTKSGKPMWRCATLQGFMVNVFQHDDPLKDSFALFVAAGYGDVMSAMTYNETINWTNYPVDVELRANGSFWNVVRVMKRPDGIMPDALEDEAGDGSDYVTGEDVS